MDNSLGGIIDHFIRVYFEIDIYNVNTWIPVISIIIFSWLLFTVLNKRYIIYSENGILPQHDDDFWGFLTIIKQILMLVALIFFIFFFRHDFQGFLNKILGN